ncbi:MAG: TetR/AcrR family transcriptional regulator [Alphaproteobacteria bacterium]
MSKTKGQIPPKPKTRDLILLTAKRLFNTYGVQVISANRVADEMGISTGNLHYHFRTKNEIIYALYKEMEAKVDPILDIEDGFEGDVERIGNDIQMMLSACLEYQFFFPEIMPICMRDERIARDYSAFQNRTVGKIAHAFRSSYVRGPLADATHPAYIDALTRNIWLIITNWLNYVKIADGDPYGEVQPVDLVALMIQIFSMMRPYMSDQAQKEYEEMFPMDDELLSLIAARFRDLPISSDTAS